ncbi:hypothetical protein [Kitasatospora sp. NPDC004289]
MTKDVDALNRRLATLHAARTASGPFRALSFTGVVAEHGDRAVLHADELLLGAPQLALTADLSAPHGRIPLRIPVLSGAVAVMEAAGQSPRMTDYHLFTPADGAHLSLTVARQPPHPDGTLVLDLTTAADLTVDRLETPAEREVVESFVTGMLHSLEGPAGRYELSPAADVRALATAALDPARRITFTTSSETPFVRAGNHRLFFFAHDGRPLDREPVLTLHGPGSLDPGAPVYVAPDTVPVHAVAVIVAELSGGPEGNLRGVHSVLLTPDHLT